MSLLFIYFFVHLMQCHSSGEWILFRYFYWKSQQRCAFKKNGAEKVSGKCIWGIPSVWSLCFLLLVIYWNQNRKNILKSHKQTFAHHMKVTIKKGKKNKHWLRVKVPQLSKSHSLFLLMRIQGLLTHELVRYVSPYCFCVLISSL